MLARAARASAERLERAHQGQADAGALAAALAADLDHLATPEPASVDPVQRAREIATALRALEAEDAADEQAAAVAAVEQAVATLGQDPQGAAAAASLARARDAASALSAQLNGPAVPDPALSAPPASGTARTQAADLARAQRGLAEAIQPVREAFERAENRTAALPALAEQLGPMIQRQQALTTQLRGLIDPRRASDPALREAERLRAAAEVAQQRAVEALARRDPARGADRLREAAERLERLAGALPDEPAVAASQPVVPDDPETGIPPGQVAAAAELAGRQRRVREGVLALLAEPVLPDQEAVREASTALGREFSALRQQVERLGARAQGPAGQAAELLERQAPPQLEQGMTQLLRGQEQPARNTRRQAAETLQRAAQQAEDVVAAIRAEAPADAGEPNAPLAAAQDAQGAAADRLAAARQALQGPGQADPANHAATAVEAMQAAADALQAAARSTGADAPSLAAAGPEPQGPPQPGDSPASTLTPETAPGGTAAADLAALQALIRQQTGRTWGSLPGHLRAEILQMASGRYREDYARLIQLYFQQIARTPARSP
jgi:hypothetical protein